MKLLAATLSTLLAGASAFIPRQQPQSLNGDLGFTTELFARKAFITGNWKLNPQTKEEAEQLATGIAESISSSSPSDVGIFVPFLFLDCVKSIVGDKAVVGAEMVTPEVAGAFTGGISPLQLKSMGVEWALAGHSERRTLFKESNQYINAQCRMLVENDMNVVLCIGETLEEFEKNLVDAVCELQLKKNLAGINAEQMMSKVVIAYEPVWAIGTGKVATPEQAQFAHATIREILSRMYGSEVAESTRILYGGSVGPESVDGLLAKPDIDGALVGGASLDPSKFGRIINFEDAAVLA
eukprot:CAMPEP_0198147746 /NCGR_PEP_ID=MMETSP1443-20131203/37567_1 /TAXON_ID=186043 /ORGANISM="Entomoneis sp., Strain CCMP2396" /LENGTH=295 /DNA_ID=CAMNT_0043812209 /DNA_START=41 /DNA_END=928 /DNA_ORIENTATION=+